MTDGSGNHTLTGAQFNALAAGFGDENALDALRQGQFSRWLMTVSSILQSVDSERTRVAADLLSLAQQQDPLAFLDIATYPMCQAWAESCLDAVIENADETVIEKHMDHMLRIAMAAAVAAGVPFSVDVRGQGNSIMLPSLGQLRLPSGDAAIERVAHHASGNLVIETDTATIEVERSDTNEYWVALRKVVTECDGLVLSVLIDDLDEYRRYSVPEYEPAGRLSSEEFSTWQNNLVQVWTLLATRHRDFAVGLAAGLRSILPAPNGPLRLMYSDRRSFGALAISAGGDAEWLAFGILHAFQKSKLQALHNQLPLHHATHDEAKYFAPWFPQARSLRELFDGVYSHHAAATFWADYRERADNPTERVNADVQFARWSGRVAAVRTTLRDTGEVTEWGERVLVATEAAMHKLRLTTTMPSYAGATARMIEIDNRISWRLRNLAPDQRAIQRLIERWTAGDICPLGLEIPLFMKNGPALVGYLARARLRELDATRHVALHSNPSDEFGNGLDIDVSDGDVALVSGDVPSAIKFFLTDLDNDPISTEAWAGLAAAHATTTTATLQPPPLATPSFTRFPEVVMAVHNRLLQDEGELASPIALASWLNPLLGTLPESPFRLSPYGTKD